MSMSAAEVKVTEANKETIRRLFRAMNEHRVGDLRDYIAADVADHNKIIHGEADEPGAAFDGFARQLAAFGDNAPGRGGHFMAHEKPEQVAAELRTFFRPLRARRYRR